MGKTIQTLWRLRKYMSLRKLPGPLLATFGTLWLITEIVNFFSPEIGSTIANYWWLFLMIGLLWAMLSCIPRKTFRCPVTGRDVAIRFQIADAFECNGALVIPTNTTFDVQLPGKDLKISSLQGQLVTKHYDKSIDLHEADIEKELSKEGYEYETLPSSKRGKRKRYPVGTTIQINRGGRLFYLLALAKVDDDGVVTGTVEDLEHALNGLWDYVSQKGEKEGLVIPPLGTGYARVLITREDSIMRIVSSFIKSCSKLNHCDELTIPIRAVSLEKETLDYDYLCTFLRHSCKNIKLLPESSV